MLVGNIRKSTLFWIIAACIAFILTVEAACSLRVIEPDYSDISCTKDGKVRFNFFYVSGEGTIDLDDVVVTANNKKINGTWYKHKSDTKRESLRSGQRAEFISDLMQVNEDRLYTIRVRYPDDDGVPKSFEYEMSCPGFEFACEIFEMNLDECYNRGGNVYLEISGSGFGDLGANLTTDFKYYLKGNSKRHEDTLVDMGAEISKVKEGLYLVKVPLGYYVSWAYIRGKPYGCSKTIDNLDTITYKKCVAETEEDEEEDEPAPARQEPAEEDDTEEADDMPEETEAPSKKGSEKQLTIFGKMIKFFLSIFGI